MGYYTLVGVCSESVGYWTIPLGILSLDSGSPCSQKSYGRSRPRWDACSLASIQALEDWGSVEEEERGERREVRAKAAPVLRKKRSGMGCWPRALGVADNKRGS